MSCQSDPTKICYYESYPNSSTDNSATERLDAAPFQLKDESKSLGNSSFELPRTSDDVLCQFEHTKICYYEYFPNSSTRNSTAEEPDAESLQSNESKSQRRVSDVSQGLNSSPELPHGYDDEICLSDSLKILYYESYPNLSAGNSSTEEPDAATLQSKHESESPRRVIDVSQILSNSPELPHDYDDLLCQYDQTKLCYYECYPNSSTGNSTTEEPDVAPLQSKHESKSQERASDVSQCLSSSFELPHSYDEVRCEYDQTKLCYYECYPNSSTGNSSTEGPDAASLQSKHGSGSVKGASDLSQNLSSSFELPHSYDDVLCQYDQIKLCYYESYPNASTSNSTIEEPVVASLQSEHESKSKRRPSDASQRSSNSPQFPQSARRQTPSSFCDLSQSSSELPPSSLKASSSSKPTLSALHHHLANQQTKASYIQKDTSPLYTIPKDIEDLIKKDIVPHVLMKPLSPSTYKDYFAALLYAEDFYFEKWSDYKLFNVKLELHEAEIYNKSSKNKILKESDDKINKTFVAFEIDSVPEKQPFLLSRDFVSARCLGNKSKQFQGLIYRVVKSKRILVEFEEDFYSQHRSNSKYDISFSFNRVCLKRAHHAVATASNSLFQNYLFPDCASRKISASAALSYRLDLIQNPAVRHILSFRGSPPYLVKGPLSVTGNQISKIGMVVLEVVLQIYKNSPKSRILICAPINKTCDVLMASLKKEIPESDMFRANAAFREIDGVPLDILPSCPYQGECFTCPSLKKLMQFRVIFSTFVSSYRLHNEGIKSGHFTHIFLVDASSATEPETMIVLSNLANENTSVILSGASNSRPSWVRSDMARKNGLCSSYFRRLCEIERYKSLNPMFITRLKG